FIDAVAVRRGEKDAAGDGAVELVLRPIDTGALPGVLAGDVVIRSCDPREPWFVTARHIVAAGERVARVDLRRAALTPFRPRPQLAVPAHAPAVAGARPADAGVRRTAARFDPAAGACAAGVRAVLGQLRDAGVAAAPARRHAGGHAAAGDAPPPPPPRAARR